MCSPFYFPCLPNGGGANEQKVGDKKENRKKPWLTLPLSHQCMDYSKWYKLNYILHTHGFDFRIPNIAMLNENLIFFVFLKSFQMKHSDTFYL